MTVTQLDEREAIAAICLMAAFADGNKDNSERERLKEIFSNLDTAFSPALYSNVLLGKLKLEEATKAIETPALRNLAYEMAVGVCDADGETLAAEQDFLDTLRIALNLDAATTQTVDRDAMALASMPMDGADMTGNLPVPTTPAPQEAQPSAADQTLNPMILKYAIMNGGLELLPQSLASMAIVPLQMKMVYRIGEHHGFKLDQGHIREFLAVVGVGMTSQVLETYARKLVGGFVKSAFGKKKKTKKKLAKMAGTATGAAMSFASTYALGQAARVYYAGGRQLSTPALKQHFSEQLAQGKVMFNQYRGDVEQSAKNTDINSLLNMVRNPLT